ncbi:tRNA preQ1(34) S-adenosylmethionine ribosyltransferase-isomerase QueA [candidate division WOR-3 bacterium]|nr:tRNA preQ1(34) S-adenosylmethionine ribosyltransferase-isomerase QueA [candidate division WOR-3 bacterium]
MKLNGFKYDLPEELIAQFPAGERAAARLLTVDRSTRQISHSVFSRIGDLLDKDDVLVLNNTKVFKARLFAHKATGGRVELLLIRQAGKDTWESMISHSKRVTQGTRLLLDRDTYVTIEEKMADARVMIRFSDPAMTIERYGIVPLPPYIRRQPAPGDEERYQTVFASEAGSIAAPTAGLHFTAELLEEIGRKVRIARITLHIGPGTFKPVRGESVEEHRMDAEYFEIPPEAISMVTGAKRVVAVGTSTCRALETCAMTGQSRGWADLFIYPGFRFQVVDRLLTNFHLPCSTPLLLVCAFAGKDLVFQAYKEAINRKYLFLSYGDAMLIT